jgi:8-oxo-dGTP pyrophosphatase MutT (NUDIX family)
MVFRAVSKLLLHPWYRLTRGMTLGTRTVVVNGEGGVLLVRHGYAPGWLLPGGGVERGETIFESAKRELVEEAGIFAGEEPAFHGLFLNDANFRGDHVAVLVLRKFRQEAFKPNLEIAEARFFAANALPEGTTGGTRRRIGEILNGSPPPSHW